MAYPGNRKRRALRRPRRSGRKRMLPSARVRVSSPPGVSGRSGDHRPRRQSKASQDQKGASKRERRQSRGVNKAVVSGLAVSLIFKLTLFCLAAATWLLVRPQIQAIQVQIPTLP